MPPDAAGCMLPKNWLDTITVSGCAPDRAGAGGADQAGDGRPRLGGVVRRPVELVVASRTPPAGEHAAYAGTATATETAGAVQAAARSTVRRLGTYESGVAGREDVMVMQIIPPG